MVFDFRTTRMAPVITSDAPRIVIAVNRSWAIHETFIQVRIPIVTNVMMGFIIMIMLTLLASVHFRAIAKKV